MLGFYPISGDAISGEGQGAAATAATVGLGGFLLGGHASQSSTVNAVSTGGFLLGGSSVMSPITLKTGVVTGKGGFILGGVSTTTGVSLFATPAVVLFMIKQPGIVATVKAPEIELNLTQNEMTFKLAA